MKNRTGKMSVAEVARLGTELNREPFSEVSFSAGISPLLYEANCYRATLGLTAPQTSVTIAQRL